MRQKRDIPFPEFPGWPSESEGDLEWTQKVVAYARQMAAHSHEWYLEERRRMRWKARWCRGLAIVATAIAGIIPMISGMTTNGGAPWPHPAWASIFLAVAGALVLFDRFFGMSGGWMRFTNAMIDIWIAVGRFDLCVAAELSPGKDGASATEAERRGRIIQRCNLLVEEVHAIVKSETDQWDQRFRDALADLDAAAGKKAEARKFEKLPDGPAPPASAPAPPSETVGEAARSET